MVAGFAEVVERKEFFGCGGLQPSEFVSPAVQNGTYSARSVASTKVYVFRIAPALTDNSEERPARRWRNIATGLMEGL
jgi:hypothetical protein